MRGEIDNRTFFAGAETQVLPSEKRFLLGRVAIIDRVACLDCGDCDSACSFGAIEQGKNNADEAFAGHRIIYEKCIGCGGCLSCCEMRAIRLADGAKGALDAEITARHDENPLPELGKPVDVFNAFGEKNQRRTRYPGSCGLKRRACGNDSVSTPPRIPVGGMLCPCGA